jgi:hypothetical protein
MREDEMGWEHSTHERGEKCLQNFGRKSEKESDHSEDLDVDGRIQGS